MSVRVLFFGQIAEQHGRREIEVVVGGELTLAALLASLNIDSEGLFLLAVNQQQVDDLSIEIGDGDEVAIMPPFSGG
ncbi:molybdopterin synthase sulfur carrier subunit [Mariprofundus micogutta]|uniref:Molybdopterin synthase sulfur carrier subunit n=1 Tax=Mariprofundus micogutta TaxID=1921010 RepID=A0A1L8CQE4_9PROT|nr:MoaD/ThiS family protein [Mariprofundus micogutta]GAV21138.1 molybdopterin synthase sulfur carrier subunit [Mariprofundus micogutta]